MHKCCAENEANTGAEVWGRPANWNADLGALGSPDGLGQHFYQRAATAKENDGTLQSQGAARNTVRMSP